jgi:hypothetical protein
MARLFEPMDESKGELGTSRSRGLGLSLHIVSKQVGALHHPVLFGMQNRTLCPCAAAISRILISVMPGGGCTSLRDSMTPSAWERRSLLVLGSVCLS